MFHFTFDMPLPFMALYGSIMILIVLILRLLLKNRLPKFVFPLLWVLVLIRLLVPFSLSSPISLPVPNIQMPISPIAEAVSEVVYSNGNVVQDTEAIILFSGSQELSMGGMLLIVAVGGMFVSAFVVWYQKRKYNRILKDSFLMEHNETVNELLRSMGFGHVLVFTNDHIASPLVSGILHPSIYLPANMDFQNIQMLRHILIHETTHIQRKDNWLKTFLLIAICLHWYNPLVWIMSKCLIGDMEAACDAAILKCCDMQERQSYAFSLLGMAITGNHPTLLYSAFSKTEVERRVKSVLRHKKTTVFILTVSFVLLCGSTMVFATGGQAPFEDYLSNFCVSTSSKWGVKVTLARDIALDKQSMEKANLVIMEVLREDISGDPTVIKEAVRAEMAAAFGVEKRAFKIYVGLALPKEQQAAEYEANGIIQDKDGRYLYQEEVIRMFTDKMAQTMQSNASGTVDVDIVRNRLGLITAVNVVRQGDTTYDQRTKEWELLPRSDAFAEGTRVEISVAQR